jgi:hypothetical protein
MAEASMTVHTAMVTVPTMASARPRHWLSDSADARCYGVSCGPRTRLIRAPQTYRDRHRQGAEPVAAQIRAAGGRAVAVEGASPLGLAARRQTCSLPETPCPKNRPAT